MGIAKSHAFPYKLVDIGCRDQRFFTRSLLVIEANIAQANIMGHDQNDVGLVLG